MKPQVRLASPTSLESPNNAAEYLLLAPREFLDLEEAEALLQRRQDQGLATRAVAIEDVVDVVATGN